MKKHAIVGIAFLLMAAIVFGFSQDTAITQPTAMQYSSMAWGDYNNDGQPDLAICGDSASADFNTLIYRLNKSTSGKFTNIDFGMIDVTECSLNWGDINNDGWNDLVVAGRYDNNDNGFAAAVYININGASFNNTQNLTGIKFGNTLLGDFDNDNDLDLVLVGCSAGTYQQSNCNTKTAQVYINSNGVFAQNSTWSSNLTGVWKGSIALGDYDADGDLDLALSGTTTSIQDGAVTLLYKNNGTAFVEDANNLLPGIFWGAMAWNDYDNDNDLDLIITGRNTSANRTTTVYQSDHSQIAENSQPSPPNTTSINYSNSQMQLLWNNGSDTETPALGLYYNIRLGSNQSGNNIVSGVFGGSSNPTQGYFGNMMQRHSIALNIPQQCAYFQVQTIDTGLRKSNWSNIQNYNSTEICDSYDNDCDNNYNGTNYTSKIDEGFDKDNDGYYPSSGTLNGTSYNCTGYASYDCNDNDGAVNPSAAESASDTSKCGNGIDENCDGSDTVCDSPVLSTQSGSGGGGGGGVPSGTPQETTKEQKIEEPTPIASGETKQKNEEINIDITGEDGKPLNDNFVWERNYHITTKKTDITERIKYVQPFSEEEVKLAIEFPKKVIESIDNLSAEEFKVINPDPHIEFELGNFNNYEIKERRYSIHRALSADDIKSIKVELSSKQLDEPESELRKQEIKDAIERAKESVNVTSTVEIFENGSAEITIDIKLLENITKVKGLNLPINIPKCLIEILKREYQQQLIESDIDLTILKEDPEVHARFEAIDSDTRFKIRIAKVADVNCTKSIDIAPTVAEIVERLGSKPKLKDYMWLLSFVGLLILIGMGFTTENVEKLRERSKKNKLIKPIVWIGEKATSAFFIVLFFLCLLGVLGMLGDFEFLKEMLSMISVVILLLRVNLSEKLFGKKSRTVTLLLVLLCIFWIVPTVESVVGEFYNSIGSSAENGFTLNAIFGKDIFNKPIYTFYHVFKNYEHIAVLSSVILFSILVIASYAIVSSSKESNSVASILIGEKRNPLKVLSVVVIIIASFNIIFQMLFEGFAIATDSYVFVAVISSFLIYNVIKNKKFNLKILTESAESIDTFLQKFVDMFRYERTLWLAISVRLLFVLLVGFIVFYLVGHLPLEAPGVYAGSEADKLYHLFFKDFNAHSGFAYNVPIVLIYVMNMFALGGFFIIPLYIFWHLLNNSLNEFSEQKKLPFNRWVIVFFMMSVTCFALMPLYSIGRMEEETVVGITTGIKITVHSLTTAMTPNLTGALIAAVALLFLLAHLIRKHKEKADIITHIVPMPFIAAYIFLFAASSSIKTDYWLVVLISLYVGVWAAIFSQKHKRIAEHKTIAFVFIFMALYFGVYVYDFLLLNLKNMAFGLSAMASASAMVIADYIIKWILFIVYLAFHLYALFALGYELYLSNEFGIHKYHIWLLDKKEIKSYLKLSRYTPELKNEFAHEEIPIREELNKGIVKKAEPHHVIIYLINHAFDINLINDIIRKDSKLNEYYHDGVINVMSEEMQELIRGDNIEDIELIARELNQLYCSKKLITDEINKSELAREEKNKLIDEYRIMWLKLLFRHHPEHADKASAQHCYSKSEIETAKSIVKETKGLVDEINKYKEDEIKVIELIKKAHKSGWKNNLIKEALYISDIDIEIIADDAVQKIIGEKIGFSEKLINKKNL